jgi:hypothetical protein
MKSIIWRQYPIEIKQGSQRYELFHSYICFSENCITNNCRIYVHLIQTRKTYSCNLLTLLKLIKIWNSSQNQQSHFYNCHSMNYEGLFKLRKHIQETCIFGLIWSWSFIGLAHWSGKYIIYQRKNAQLDPIWCLRKDLISPFMSTT